MKNFLDKLFYSKASILTITALTSICLLISYGARFGNVFIDNTLFSGFSLILFILAILDTIFLTASVILKMKNSNIFSIKIFKIAQIISILFAFIFIVINLGTLAVSGTESTPVAFRLMKKALPFWAAINALCIALFIMPNMKNKNIKKILAGTMAVIMIIAVYGALFPTTQFKFTSTPAVFDTGKNYSIVFSTNDIATAYVEFNYNGKEMKIYNEDNGRKNGDSIIHTIQVPYEQLSGNAYKVCATRVIDELSYGGRTGKTIESDFIEFNDTFGEDINILTISDWHTKNDLAQRTISYLGNYNAVILLGDCAPGLMVPEEVAEYLIKFAGNVSGGTMPIIFARGNHETRGREAAKLSTYLGMESFYYTTKLGNYNFIVLDSGEDKKDDHSEYGGMVVYEQNREKMVSWLSSLKNTDTEKTIAISHDKNICLEEELSTTAITKLESLNTSLLLSGHYHSTEYFENDFPYPVLIDGGVDAAGKGTYVASMISINNDKIDIHSVDSNGNTTIKENILWN